MNSSCKPQSATEALEKALKFVPNHVISVDKPMINSSALKRTRSIFDSFDMSEFDEASKQLEESISFPSIEWNFNDDNDEDEYSQPSKRQCRGLARSNGSGDLSSLASSDRNGSTGSLC